MSRILFVADLAVEVSIIFKEDILKELMIARFIFGILAGSLFFKSLLLDDKILKKPTKYD